MSQLRILFGVAEELDAFYEDELNGSDFEYPYEVVILEDSENTPSRDWLEIMYKVTQYGSYILISNDELDRLDF
jgi:hypothetical protein